MIKLNPLTGSPEPRGTLDIEKSFDIQVKRTNIYRIYVLTHTQVFDTNINIYTHTHI